MTGRPTVAEVDLVAIRDNAETVRGRLGPGVRLVAVVKADGYGHGAGPVARAALAGGAEALSVALAEEGASLRAQGIDAPILVMGPTLGAQAAIALQAGLETTIYDSVSARLLAEAAEREGVRAPVLLKVDTGMGRIGVAHDGGVLDMALDLVRQPSLHLVGLMTHLASADAADPQSALRQWARFLDVVDALRRAGIEVPFVHGANSAAALRWPGMQGSQVRVGIALYGIAPDPVSVQLKPALSLRSAVAQVKRVGPGFPVGYGETFVSEDEAVLATVPVGYADGYRRAFSNRGRALVGGAWARVAGRVSMDQTVFALPGTASVAVGDPVVLMGAVGAEAVSALDWAGWADTIPYEVLCGIGPRVPRVYRIREEGRPAASVDADFLASL